MRQLMGSLALLVGLFGLSLWNTACVTDISDGLVETLEQAEAAVSDGNWDRGLALTRQGEQTWERWQPYVSMVLRHVDTDDVTITFQEVEGFLLWEDEAEYTSANRVLLEKVAHLAKVEALTWSNLF